MGNTQKLINIITAPLLVIIAIGIAVTLVKGRKALAAQEAPVAIAKVSVLESAPVTVTPTIETFGNTRSHLTTTLASQVSGEILKLAPGFEVGRFVSKGELLLEINPADYQAMLAERKSSLAAALQSLADEETRSQLAKDDWIASGRKLADAAEFTLRQPQLVAAEAAVTAAEASVSKASLDLERTQVRAPFDAIVEARSASPGNIVATGVSFGTLLAREKIEVRLALTPEQVTQLDLGTMREISLPSTLTTPTLPDRTWKATIRRVEPSVDTKTQTLWVIAEVKAPFASPDAFLPVGAFVNAKIEGKPRDAIHRFPEALVVEDSYVWLVSPENELSKQTIDIDISQAGMIGARITEPLFPLPLQVVERPLSSFKTGQRVEVLTTSQP